MSTLSAVEINPQGTIKTSIIWLHGLGADGHDFEAIVPELLLPDTLGIRYVFPHAPIMPVTINMGSRMRAWYDIAHPDIAHEPDMAGIVQSANLIETLVKEEKARAEKIILAGFSQGGVIALYLGLRHVPAVDGILALSTYLVDQPRFKTPHSALHAQIPIMMMHGVQDPIVPVTLAEQSKNFLQEHGYNINWKTYPMPHSVHPQQIMDIAQWIREVAG